MKVRILFISLVLLVVTNTISQTFKLKIEIENIEQKGTVYLAIYDNSTSFDQDNKNKNVNKNRWVKSIVEVVNKNSFTKNVELKKGVYAISLFVDSNNNKITNMLIISNYKNTNKIDQNLSSKKRKDK